VGLVLVEPCSECRGLGVIESTKTIVDFGRISKTRPYDEIERLIEMASDALEDISAVGLFEPQLEPQLKLKRKWFKPKEGVVNAMIIHDSVVLELSGIHSPFNKHYMRRNLERDLSRSVREALIKQFDESIYRSIIC
jgi:hypothetical protein